MFHLDIVLKIGEIKTVEKGDLIAYGDGSKWAIGMERTPNDRPTVFSLSELKMIIPVDDWGEAINGFKGVANYGLHYYFHVTGPCDLQDHICSSKPGCLIMKGEKLYLAVSPLPTHGGGLRGVDLIEGRSKSGDTIGYNVGVFETWEIVVFQDARVSAGGLSVFRFP